MKKIICIVLALIMTASVCACGALKDVELPPLPTATADSGLPAPENAEGTAAPEASAEPAPAADRHTIVKIINTEMKEFDPENGSKLILTFSYDTPIVYIEGGDAAAAKINEYTAMLEEAYYTGENYGEGSGTGYLNMLTMAEDNYNLGRETEGAVYELSSTRNIYAERADEAVLCLKYTDYVYTGGAKGVYSVRGYCFDAVSGERITLSMLGRDYAELENRMLDYMVSSVESSEHLTDSIDLSMTDAPDLRGFLGTILKDDSWYFDKDGIVVVTDIEEVSAGEAGLLVMHIPYSELEGVIDEKWMPAAREEGGSFRLVAAADMADGSTEIIDKLTVDRGGEELYLVAEGKVYDVRISTVEYSGSFYETAQKWYCSEMNGSALQLETVVPDGMPTLKISWSSGSEEYSKLISQSGENGSYIFADTDIEAVG